MDNPFSSPRIQRLSTQLANQIAAGEVVERPASVVKELLENSLDAGARQLEVDIERGGVGLIRVRDDGAGIEPDDLPLAPASHATSKIHSVEDLFHVHSLGFRGEALASISSVARLVITSCRPEGDGARLDCTREPWQVLPAPHPRGTTVEVRDLFYNTPARRKFLRTERTELGHVEEVVRRLALGRFDCGFVLRHNQRQILGLRPGADPSMRERRIGTLLGKGFADNAIALDLDVDGMHLWGWVGRAEYSRSQADGQYFYVNGRIVRDKLISHALRQGFRDTLPEGRYPGYVLYLELDPALVDVNVHPTKHEVRFREARKVHDFLFHALYRLLQGDDWAELTPPASEAVRPPDPAAAPSSVALAAQSVTPRPPSVEGEYAPRQPLFPARPAPAQVREQLQGYGRLADSVTQADAPKSTLQSRSPLSPRASVARPTSLDGRYLTRHDEGVLLVLDVAMARRTLCRNALQQGVSSGVRSRPLLVPISVRMSTAATSALLAAGDILSRLGLGIDPLGSGSVAVRQLPAALGSVDVGELVEDLARFLEQNADLSASETTLIERLAGFAARARDALDGEAGSALIRAAQALPPNERDACLLRLGADELAQLFANRGRS